MENRSTWPHASAILIVAASPASPPPITMILGVDAIQKNSLTTKDTKGHEGTSATSCDLRTHFEIIHVRIPLCLFVSFVVHLSSSYDCLTASLPADARACSSTPAGRKLKPSPALLL